MSDADIVSQINLGDRMKIQQDMMNGIQKKITVWEVIRGEEEWATDQMASGTSLDGPSGEYWTVRSTGAIANYIEIMRKAKGRGRLKRPIHLFPDCCRCRDRESNEMAAKYKMGRMKAN